MCEIDILVAYIITIYKHQGWNTWVEKTGDLQLIVQVARCNTILHVIEKEL